MTTSRSRRWCACCWTMPTRRARWCSAWCRRSASRAERARPGCDHALDNAIITAAHMRDPALVAKLDAVAGRVLS